MKNYTQEIIESNGLVFLGRESWSVYYPETRENGSSTRKTLSGYYDIDKSVFSSFNLDELIQSGVVVIDHRMITWEQACDSIKLPMLARSSSDIDGTEDSCSYVTPKRYKELSEAANIGAVFYNI